LPDSRGSSRRRLDDGPPNDRPAPSLSEGVNDWRSMSRPRPTAPEPETISSRRKGSGFSTPEGQPSAADKEEVWTIGSKFKPSSSGTPDENVSGSKFGSIRGKGDLGAPRDPASSTDENSDWRSAARPRSAARNNTSRKFTTILLVHLRRS
jgi:hypothetical protein